MDLSFVTIGIIFSHIDITEYNFNPTSITDLSPLTVLLCSIYYFSDTNVVSEQAKTNCVVNPNELQFVNCQRMAKCTDYKTKTKAVAKCK